MKKRPKMSIIMRLQTWNKQKLLQVAFIYDDCVRIWYGNKMKTQNNVFAWNSRWSHSKNSGSNKSFIHPFILAAIATTSELNKWWEPYKRCWKRCSVDWAFKPVSRKEVNEEKLMKIGQKNLFAIVLFINIWLFSVWKSRYS